MAARKTISKKLRFEVFKRDNFTCQYCGGMAPDVVLEVDHINPVANGGETDDRTVEKSFNYVPKIANVRRKQKDDPRIAQRNYVKAILKNRLSYVNHEQYTRMTRNLALGDFGELKEIACCCRNWADFKDQFDETFGDDY